MSPGHDERADLHDAALVEIAEGLLADIGNVAGELLAAELRLADFDVELLDVDRGVGVFVHQLFADDDRVLEVVALVGHERDEHVAAQGQVALERRGAVGDDVALLHLVADLDDRLLVLAGPLVEADELPQVVHLGADLDAVGVDVGDRALVAGPHEHARVPGHVALQAGADDRRLGQEQRHGLPLHVRTHERAVRVVVLQERNQPGRHADHLARRHVGVLNLLGRHEHEVAPPPGHDRVALNLVVLHRHVGRGDVRLRLLVGPQPHDVAGQLAVLHLAVRRDQEAVVVHRGVHRQARDEPDVRAFRRLDRADAAVVRNVHVAHFEAGPLAIETARAEGRQPPLVREHRQRVGLVDHLRQLAAAEEVLDRRRDALGVDEAPRRHVGGVLQAHPLLHGAAELEEALADFVARQLVDRPQAAIAQVVDVVDVRLALAGHRACSR